MRTSLMRRLIELEEDIRYRKIAEPGEEEFRYLAGSLPLLVSAPHGAAHQRNGNLKEEDEFTGAMAQYLASETGCHALYLRRRSQTDPNYDKDNPYKDFIKSIVLKGEIRFVVDLHGASDRHAFGVALGTMNGRSCPEQLPLILNVFKEFGFTTDGQGFEKLDLDGRFTAAGGFRQETVTRYAHDTLGISALQIELASYIRVVEVGLKGKSRPSYKGDTELIEKAVGALTELVKRLGDDLLL